METKAVRELFRTVLGLFAGLAAFTVVLLLLFDLVIDTHRAPWWPRPPMLVSVAGGLLSGLVGGVVSSAVARTVSASYLLGGLILVYLFFAAMAGVGSEDWLRFVATLLAAAVGVAVAGVAWVRFD